MFVGDTFELNDIYDYIRNNPPPDIHCWRLTHDTFTCDYNDIIVSTFMHDMNGTFIVPQNDKGEYPKIVILMYGTITGIIGDVTKYLILNRCYYKTDLIFDISGNIYIVNIALALNETLTHFYIYSHYLKIKRFYKFFTRNMTFYGFSQRVSFILQAEIKIYIDMHFVRIVCPLNCQKRIRFIGVVGTFASVFKGLPWRL